MPDLKRRQWDEMPRRAGVGLKVEHYRNILDLLPDIGFFEIHAENYMAAGGAPHRYLSAIRERFPLSIHGVGLSIRVTPGGRSPRQPGPTNAKVPPL